MHKGKTPFCFGLLAVELGRSHHWCTGICYFPSAANLMHISDIESMPGWSGLIGMQRPLGYSMHISKT